MQADNRYGKHMTKQKRYTLAMIAKGFVLVAVYVPKKSAAKLKAYARKLRAKA